jgi:pyridoxine 5-phosphate synthase
VNIGPIMKIREIGEVSIGHAVIAKALEVGMERAVREMLALMRRATGSVRSS